MRYLSLIILALTFAISSSAQSVLRPGNAAPVFSGQSIDGTNYELDSMRGTVVVMTFWSTKCQICQSEIPKLNSFKSRFDENKVIFLALTNESDARVEKYLKANPFAFHVLPNSFGVVLQYADRDKQGNLDLAYPSYFLIDQEGKIAYRSYGWDKTAELESRISQLLAEK